MARSTFRSGPLMITAKSADDPVTASMTMSIIGCVKLKVAPGMVARSFSESSLTRSAFRMFGGHVE